MELFKLGSAFNADNIIMRAPTKCGCYMSNASCGASVDFGSSGKPTQECGQSALSKNSPVHVNCPNG